MKTIAALGVFWLLLITAATAQPHQLGPWRVKYKPGEVEEYHVNNRDGGSTLMRRTATELVKAAWDVPPDSIRLFLNCNNPLLAPPTRASIRFTATGATLRLDKQHQLLWIFPTAPTVTLTAHQGKAQLFTHGFQAVAPPPPEIRAYITGLNANICKGPRTPPVRSVVLKAIPNTDFLTQLPDEARYRVARSTGSLMRGDTTIVSPFAMPGGCMLTDLEPLSKPGDYLRVEVEQVQRMNTRGDIEDVANLLPERLNFNIKLFDKL